MGNYGNWAWLSRTAHPHISSLCNATLEGKYLWPKFFFKAVYKNGTYFSLDVCKMLCGSSLKATNIL